MHRPSLPDESMPAKLAPDQALQLANARTAVLIDVRTPQQYDQEHIPGATLLPVDSIAADQLPADKMVILYCGGGSRATRAAERLAADGRTSQVAIVSGGLRGWKSAGLPTEP